MPRIESWDNLPPNVRQHLIDRMRTIFSTSVLMRRTV
jgi:hypothetical protein